MSSANGQPPCPQDLDGFWKSSTGGLKHIRNGSLDGKPMEVEDGKLMLFGVMLTPINENVVKFPLGKETVQWTRLEPEDFDGLWSKSDGGYLNIKKGCMDDKLIVKDRGEYSYPGAVLSACTDETFTWTVNGQSVEWTRLEPQHLDGFWKNAGSVKEIAGGKFGNNEILGKNGKLTMAGGILSDISDNTLTWDVPGHSKGIQWTRLLPADLDGLWKSSSGGIKTIKNGAFDGHDIEVVKGKVTLIGGFLKAATPKDVTWDFNGEMIHWTRLLPKDLDGFWKSSTGGIRNVSGGCFDNARISQSGGQLSVLGGTLADVRDDTLSWRIGQDTIKWTRLQPDDLDGLWISSSDSSVRKVKRGKFGDVKIISKDGKLMAAGGTLTSVSEDLLVWKSGGQSVRWTRLRLEDLQDSDSSSSSSSSSSDSSDSSDSDSKKEEKKKKAKRKGSDAKKGEAGSKSETKKGDRVKKGDKAKKGDGVKEGGQASGDHANGDHANGDHANGNAGTTSEPNGDAGPVSGNADTASLQT